jgi:hypothetical protein
MYQNRPNLANQTKWVVVSQDKVFHYETFQEAILDKSGNLMPLNYYELHYKPLHDESAIPGQ